MEHCRRPLEDDAPIFGCRRDFLARFAWLKRNLVTRENLHTKEFFCFFFPNKNKKNGGGKSLKNVLLLLSFAASSMTRRLIPRLSLEREPERLAITFQLCLVPFQNQTSFFTPLFDLENFLEELRIQTRQLAFKRFVFAFVF